MNAQSENHVVVLIPKGFKGTIVINPDEWAPDLVSDINNTSHSEYSLSHDDNLCEPSVSAPAPVEAQLVPSSNLLAQITTEKVKPRKMRTFDFTPSELATIHAAIKNSVPYITIWDQHFKRLARPCFKYRWECISQDLRAEQSFSVNI